MARLRSFSGAAKELFLSQPAVSRQVSSLENEIGLPLFVRMGNNISMTDPGRRLLTPTTNLVMASIVPINRWGIKIVDRAKLEITIRDEMLNQQVSGNILVGQTD